MIALLPVLAWLGGAALAASPGGTLWTRTGLSGRPDLLGRPSLRAEQQLGGVLPLAGGWTLSGLGSVRDPSAVGASLTGDLLLLHARWDGPSTAVEGGRFVALDVRGAQHLDGVRVEGGGDVGLRGWAGRRWHPETWRTGTTLVGGGALTARIAPGMPGELGVEGRVTEDGEAQVRPFGALTRRGARGGVATVLVEVAAGDEAGERARLGGDLPVRGGRLGGALRWEGLAEDLLPVALDTPMAWLAPDGYAAADARALRQRGAWVLDAQGGPVVHPGQGVGGSGRVGAGLRRVEGATGGVAAVGAGLGAAALAGGVVDLGVRRAGHGLVADAGCFRLRPSTGPAVTTWEARLTGLVPVRPGRADTALRVRAEAAVGVDRVLAPFGRGGVVLEGALGRPGSGR